MVHLTTYSAHSVEHRLNTMDAKKVTLMMLILAKGEKRANYERKFQKRCHKKDRSICFLSHPGKHEFLVLYKRQSKSDLPTPNCTLKQEPSLLCVIHDIPY